MKHIFSSIPWFPLLLTCACSSNAPDSERATGAIVGGSYEIEFVTPTSGPYRARIDIREREGGHDAVVSHGPLLEAYAVSVGSDWVELTRDAPQNDNGVAITKLRIARDGGGALGPKGRVFGVVQSHPGETLAETPFELGVAVTADTHAPEPMVQVYGNLTLSQSSKADLLPWEPFIVKGEPILPAAWASALEFSGATSAVKLETVPLAGHEWVGAPEIHASAERWADLAAGGNVTLSLHGLTDAAGNVASDREETAVFADLGPAVAELDMKGLPAVTWGAIAAATTSAELAACDDGSCALFGPNDSCSGQGGAALLLAAEGKSRVRLRYRLLVLDPASKKPLPPELPLALSATVRTADGKSEVGEVHVESSALTETNELGMKFGTAWSEVEIAIPTGAKPPIALELSTKRPSDCGAYFSQHGPMLDVTVLLSHLAVE